MDTRFLETFLLVAEHGSLAEAARRQGLTPAAVTQRVAALEAELGTPLLKRVGRRVRPTEAGHAILSGADRVLADLRRLRAIALADLSKGDLRIGAISTALSGLLPRALLQLRAELPEVEFFVLPGASSDLYAALGDGRLDAALIVRPPFPLPKTHDFQEIRSDPLVLLTPADLAAQDPGTLLREQPFIRYDRHNWGGKIVDAWLVAHGIRPRDWIELDQLEAIAVMVSAGLGISILPEWVPPWPEGVTAARLRLPGPALHRNIDLVWKRDTPVLSLLQRLIAALQNTVPRTADKA